MRCVGENEGKLFESTTAYGTRIGKMIGIFVVVKRKILNSITFAHDPTTTLIALDPFTVSTVIIFRSDFIVLEVVVFLVVTVQ